MTGGGKRKGAGRPAERGERKVSLTVGVTPTLREFFDEQEESISEFVEKAIRLTKRFREWEKARKG